MQVRSLVARLSKEHQVQQLSSRMARLFVLLVLLVLEGNITVNSKIFWDIWSAFRFLYGYNQGSFSGILTMPSFGARKIEILLRVGDFRWQNIDMGDWVTNQTKLGWMASIIGLGAWVGCLYAGFLAEILSRKYAILVNVIIFVFGIVIQCLGAVSGASCMLVGRFITGK